MSAAQSSVAVLRVFALLFSPRWIRQWQQREGVGAAAAGAKKKPGVGSMNASSHCRSRGGI
jgi:hypothetical protein